MKSLFVLIIMLVSGCKFDPLTEDKAPEQNKGDKLDMENLCSNERLSIINRQNNWEVQFDSFETIEDYFKAAIDQRHRYAQEDTHQNNNGTGVYPFVKTDNLIISLGSLRKISSVGYVGNGLSYHLSFRGMRQYSESKVQHEVEAFFESYNDESINKCLDNEICNPRIIVDIKNAPMSEFKLLATSLAEAYIKMLRQKALELYSKELCSISEIQLSELKERFPFTVEILFSGSF